MLLRCIPHLQQYVVPMAGLLTALNSLYNGTICMAALAGFYTTHAVKKLQKFVLYEKNMQKEKLTKKRFLTDDTYQRIIAFKFKIPYVPRLLYLK